ncbi:hypothetical protein E2C01_101368 [Portunus trituberculatus]|uniref:Uncharacterized protein n=1 Tax=Portunus trituberculatus TaxID=210409 RepID=A0A5B7KFE8_PORTR|nr:hypothetical protein [Portunus trituberculatus]
MTRPVVVVVVLVLVAAGLPLGQTRTTGRCNGACQRLDGNGFCRTVYNCRSDTGGEALGSIFAPTPCRQRCYAFVRGRCRLKFSCLLG